MREQFNYLQQMVLQSGLRNPNQISEKVYQQTLASNHKLRPRSMIIAATSNIPSLVSYSILQEPTVMAFSQNMQPSLSWSWLVEFAAIPFLKFGHTEKWPKQ